MQIDDQTRTNLNRTYTSLVRGSPFAASVNLQQASLALFTILEHTEDGQPIDLGALLFYFTHEAKVPEGQATELCVVLKSREARFPGLVFALPQSCADLSPEQIAAIVEQFNARGGDKAATYEKKPAEPLPGVPMGKAWTPKKKGKFPLTKNQVLYILLAVSVLGSVVNFVNMRRDAPDPLVEIKFPKDSAGLPCEEDAPPMSKGVARCVVPRALYVKEGVEGLKSRGEITMRAMKPHGVTKLYVVIKEDRKIRASLP